jgi:Ca2+-binding EF-hand superfamily protein
MIPAARVSGLKAERTPSRCLENFRFFDRDRDHLVSLEELADGLDPSLNADSVFRQRDRDGDGYLIERELCARIGTTTMVTPLVSE